MEKQITIKTKDNHVIYGTLNWQGKKPKDLIVFVHGLTGDSIESKYIHAARYFPKKNVATFRFDLYSWKKNARTLRKCTLGVHANDVQLVLGRIGKSFRNVFLVGHSLGALVILTMKLSRVKGVIFWDGSYGLNKMWANRRSRFQYLQELRSYLVKGGTEFLLGRRMFDEILNFHDYHARVQTINAPIKFIYAGKGILKNGGKEYFRHANEPKEFVIIKNATHNFTEEGAEEQLFKETLKFVRKFSK